MMRPGFKGLKTFCVYLLTYLLNERDVTGQPIDSASNGRAPLPWEIHCHPTQMFHDETHLIEVPHTAAIAVSTPASINRLYTVRRELERLRVAF